MLRYVNQEVTFIKTNRQSLKIWIAFLCIILIFSYAVTALSSHPQECFDSDCVVCAIIKSSRNILIVLALSAAIYPIIEYTAFNIHPNISSYQDDTLVGLKVKLSN